MKGSNTVHHASRASGLATRCCAALLLFTVVAAGCSQPSGSSSANIVSRLYTNSFACRRLQQAPAKRPATPPATAGNKTSSSGNSTAVKPKPQNAVCEWSGDTSTCSPTTEVWLAAGPGMPSSHYTRAVLMASARDRHCSQHKAARACAADLKMRCLWQGGANATNARCASSDMEEMLLWASKVGTCELQVCRCVQTYSHTV